MIEVRDTGVVYRNPKPHLRADHTWHPSVVRLDTGELLVAFDRGQGAEALDYRNWLARSQDDGKTWSQPERTFPEETPRRSSHTFRIGRSADGTLVAFGHLFWRDDPEEGLINRANLGFVPTQMLVMTSRDGGHQWSKPTVVEPPLVGPGFEPCHSLVELRDGRWLWPTSTWRGWDGALPNGWKCVALVSRDRAKSWPEYLEVMDQWDRGLVAWEVGLLQLPDDRLLAVTWAYEEKTGKTHPTPYALSSDGRTFSKPRPTGLHGQTAKLLALPDGRILCLYRANDRPGLRAAVARIQGEDWVTEEETALWTGAASGMAGQRNSGDELSALRFGYPQMVNLPGGEVFAVFWCAEDMIQNIRWLRLAVH
jgi:hypothetical protein